MIPKSQLPDINLRELKELCELAPDGLILEIGVYKGGSAYALNEVAKGRTLHLFDTFTGIPEKSPVDQIHVGAFNDAVLSEVLPLFPDAVFHVGKFPDTLTDDVTGIAFVHVDCDQYLTCKLAIETLWPRMIEGGVMAFDDYPFEGIKKAIHEKFIVTNFTKCQIPYVIKEKE